ncbi:hypothetical protein DVS28_a4948 [Euzebya pacifica]|uniref:VOC domain-containing protein n=1 Tax=Euzebya pacifica TaxID=1608957 RepID=A0A346Y558_9ACTN|nr:VOC family protein [Euzebya pacifica]AXV09605.1 hypothetical protein DVS28_a4948 [Euzebya pacifica]
MRITVDALLIDTPDPDALAMFWEDLLGWVRTFEDEGEVMIAPRDGQGFPLLFVEVDDAKAGKNRLHFDLRPDDQAAAIAKAIDLGATRVDIGQHEDPHVTWEVLADPDGNEFCILSDGTPDADPDLIAEARAKLDAAHTHGHEADPDHDHG